MIIFKQVRIKSVITGQYEKTKLISKTSQGLTSSLPRLVISYIQFYNLVFAIVLKSLLQKVMIGKPQDETNHKDQRVNNEIIVPIITGV